MGTRKIAVWLAAVALCLATVAGCNAVKGLGQDLQTGAQAVQDVVDQELEQSRQW